jgi:hypothetical protein
LTCHRAVYQRVGIVTLLPLTGPDPRTCAPGCEQSIRWCCCLRSIFEGTAVAFCTCHAPTVIMSEPGLSNNLFGKLSIVVPQPESPHPNSFNHGDAHSMLQDREAAGLRSSLGSAYSALRSPSIRSVQFSPKVGNAAAARPEPAFRAAWRRSALAHEWAQGACTHVCPLSPTKPFQRSKGGKVTAAFPSCQSSAWNRESMLGIEWLHACAWSP